MQVTFWNFLYFKYIVLELKVPGTVSAMGVWTQVLIPHSKGWNMGRASRELSLTDMLHESTPLGSHEGMLHNKVQIHSFT